MFKLTFWNVGEVGNFIKGELKFESNRIAKTRRAVDKYLNNVRNARAARQHALLWEGNYP